MNAKDALGRLDAYLARYADAVQTEADVERLIERFLAEQESAPKRDSAQADAALEEALAMMGQDPDAARSLLARALETFPDDLRLRLAHARALAACGMTAPAIRACRALLRAQPDDLPGVRFLLMHLLAYTGDLAEMEAVHLRYEHYEETGMLLPLCLGAYRAGDLEAARDALTRLRIANPGTEAFLRAAAAGERACLRPEGRVRPFTEGELCRLAQDYAFAFAGAEPFFLWALRALAL